MNAKRLIELIDSTALLTSDMSAWAATRRLSLHELCDTLSLEIAKLYLSHGISWKDGDAAMNGLFSWAYDPDDVGLPPFSWAVYQAFDEGEYIHPGEPLDTDSTLRTAPMLLAALAQPPIAANASRRG